MKNETSPTIECSFCQKLHNIATIDPRDMVLELPHSMVLLGPWQYYWGYCIVVCKQHARELHELPTDFRFGYFQEMVTVAKAINAAFTPRKINYELLGNQVPHLHWHLFPRYVEDTNHLNAVWLDLAKADADAAWKVKLQGNVEERAATIAAIRKQIELLGV